jgi:hypothetical protein
MGSNVTIHLPSVPAVAVFFCPANPTVTDCPLPAHPQIGTGFSRCNTILSPKTRASRSPADAAEAKHAKPSSVLQMTLTLFIFLFSLLSIGLIEILGGPGEDEFVHTLPRLQI